MRAHLVNGACGVLDYIAYPAGMLALAPIILRHRGLAEYGVWAVSTAVVSTGAILASGFGDAGIQAVASARGSQQIENIRVAVRAMMSVHLVLGGCIAAAIFIYSGLGASFLQAGEEVQIRTSALVALRCASVLLLLRAIEAVCISTQRAFEKYGSALSISVSGRLCSLLVAGLLALRGGSVAQMMMGALSVQVFSVGLQIAAIARRTGWIAIVPAFHWRQLSTIVRDGRYTWLIAASGVLFTYSDRLLLGFGRGAGSVAEYALCVQLAQPIYGVAANGLHFLFPYFARINAHIGAADFAKVVRRATVVNVGLAAGLSVAVGVGGWSLLRILVKSVVVPNEKLLLTVALSFGLLSASVVATYALVAIRMARQVAITFAMGAIAMFGLMPVMLARWGEEGMASARLIFGFACLLLYLPLFRAIQEPSKDVSHENASGLWADVKGDAS